MAPSPVSMVAKGMGKMVSWMNLINIVVLVLVLYYFMEIRKYLEGLAACHCAPHNEAKHLYDIELYYIVLLSLSILSNLAMFFFTPSFKWIAFLLNTSLVLSLVTLVVHFFFIYYVLEFYKKSRAYCDCLQGTGETLLYIQAFFYGIPVALVLMSVAMAATAM